MRRLEEEREDAERARPATPPEPSPLFSSVVTLQRSAGNAAVGRWLATQRPLARTTIVDLPEDKNLPKDKRRGQLASGSRKKSGAEQWAQFGALNADGCGTWMEAYINSGFDDLEGTEPLSGTWPPFWNGAVKPTSSAYWVRGHLLNHNLGGPGEQRNLTPITKKANSQHHSLIEALLKAAADTRAQTIHYRVDALYSATGPALSSDRTRDPDPSIWPKLCTALQCTYALEDGVQSIGGSQTIVNQH